MKKISLDIHKLYQKELFDALLSVSNNKLDIKIAEKVSTAYSANLDYSNPALMHIGVRSVASDLITKIKPEYFSQM